MKKILGLVAAMAIFTGNLFAWTNFIGLGLKIGIPESYKFEATIDVDGIKTKSNESFTAASTGLNIDYIGTFDSGFSLKENFNSGFGALSFNLPSGTSSDFSFNYGIQELIGLGYAFINNEKFFLGAYGNIGLNLNLGLQEYTMNRTSEIISVVETGFLLGGDVTFIFTPNGVFSLFASCSLNTSLPTDIGLSNSALSSRAKISTSSIEPSFVAIPVIGLGWKF